MGNNNSNDNTIKIISWNVNQFCKREHWSNYDKTQKELLDTVQWRLNQMEPSNFEEGAFEKLQAMYNLEKNKHKSFYEVRNKIVELLNEKEPDILILHEVPYGSRFNCMIKESREYIEKLEEAIEEAKINYEIKYPFYTGNSIFISIALVKTSANFERKDKDVLQNVSYRNRRVMLTYENDLFNILGIHMDSKDIKESIDIWDLLSKSKEFDIIIGDLNVDNESTDRWKYMNELLKNVGYEEAKGDAKRKEIGDPKTHYYKNENGKEEGSHVDYALIREDSKSKFTVEKYRILTDYKEYSDHYPIMLEINLNNDKEEA